MAAYNTPNGGTPSQTLRMLELWRQAAHRYASRIKFEPLLFYLGSWCANWIYL